jgi:hypothetical protein
LRIRWAWLLKRVFGIDIEHRPNCGGELKSIGAILEPPIILTQVGLLAMDLLQREPTQRAACHRAG